MAETWTHQLEPLPQTELSQGANHHLPPSFTDCKIKENPEKWTHAFKGACLWTSGQPSGVEVLGAHKDSQQMFVEVSFVCEMANLLHLIRT